MKKDLLLGTLLLLAGYTTNASAQVSNDNEDGVYKVQRHQMNDFVPGQVLVKMKDGNPANVRRVKGRFQSAGVSELDKVLTQFGVEEMEQLLPNAKVSKTPRKAKAYNGQTILECDLTQLYKVTLSPEKANQTHQLVNELNMLDEVEYAEPNYKVYMTDASIVDSYESNPLNGQQWYLDAYGVKELWSKPIINPKRPVIAIIDTGVDMTHPDLVDNLWTNTAEAEGEEGYDNDGNGFASDVHGWDFVNNSPNVRDNNMHGTHVAGIAAAANNDIGIVGANPQALIMPIAVLQSDGSGDVATIVKGIDYATQNGADVLNLSLGTNANSRAMRQALERAYQTAVIVAAAGNDSRCVNSDHDPSTCNGAAPHFPGAYSFVLGVQATQPNGSLANFSNYDDNGNTYSSVTTLQDPDGFNYELKASGTDILSTVPGGKYKILQGTSMASPLVAGAISALMMVKEYDTQDLLWGDLLYTENIAQAYAVEERPAELDMQKVQMRKRKNLIDETEEDYSGNNEVDAGETVSIYPVIRTTFGAASNIKLKLEGQENSDIVEILTDEVDFGMHLDANGKGVSLNPLVMKVLSNAADGRRLRLMIVGTCDESEKTFKWPFSVTITNMVKLNGLITDHRTLTADHVYLVNDNLAILEGGTLTIEPGTHMEFAEGVGITSFGKLEANGTPEKPIVFTGNHGVMWTGIKSHPSNGILEEGGDYIYTNADSTLFTLKPTNLTPNKMHSSFGYYAYNDEEVENNGKNYSLWHYMDLISEGDYTAHQDLLTDPSYLTPSILKMMADAKEYCSQFQSDYSETYPYAVGGLVNATCHWYVYSNPRDTISYCQIEGYDGKYGKDSDYYPYMRDCVIKPHGNMAMLSVFNSMEGVRNTITDINGDCYGISNPNLCYSNIVNNYFGTYASNLPSYSDLAYNNYFNNYATCNIKGKYKGKRYAIGSSSSIIVEDKSDMPSYLGTGSKDIIRPYIYEIGNAPSTYNQVNLSNMPTRPYAEAHGIVWKVVVNGKDAQDEYEDLAPLGVGKHKFEVYFNRSMNKDVAPQIMFGVRDPWTQNTVNEDGSWNEEGTIYTAYKTITGKTKSDGVNRIYVYGAEDNEFFEIPYEKTRFNIHINAAGSLATGFAAEPKMGCVKLTWNNEENDFEDAMGFNIYRYTVDKNGKADTICINNVVVDIETTEYTDYDVTPGETYYYLYRVLSTDLKEFDVSNVVAVTPLTSILGDANGSGDVDVADVITTVNYAAGMEPKPFIFEAADMNTDKQIDILDVIGIIQKILNPEEGARLMAEAEAIYTIEDRTLYVESPVALAGVQMQLCGTSGYNDKYEVAKDLNGFEHTSAWLSENDYLFLAYNLNGKTLSAGKHALLHIGDADVTTLRLSDVSGHNVKAVPGSNTTRIDAMGSKVLQGGAFNLKGQKIAGKNVDLKKLPKGVYIINGEKVVK